MKLPIKKNKRHQNGKSKNPSSFRKSYGIYKKLVRREFRKFVVYKVNLQNSTGFLYANSAQSEIEIKRNIFKSIYETIMNVTERLQNLYTKNYKIFLGEIKRTQINRKLYCFLESEDST